jgi:hypothetical protein
MSQYLMWGPKIADDNPMLDSVEIHPQSQSIVHI